jgi:Flp pilus assembly protein CpaB
MVVMLRRRWVALTAAVVAAGLAVVVGSSAVARAQADARAGFVTVTVARHLMAEGAVIGRDDLREVRVPPEAAPPGAEAEAVGRTVTITLLPGDIVTAGKLAPSGRGVSALLRQGEVAAALVPAAPVLAEPGEKVRITATFDPERYAGNDLVRVVAATARVISRDDKDGHLTVALTARQRDELSLASGQARIDAAVVAPGGGDTAIPAAD